MPRWSVPLSSNTRPLPASPLTEPPTLNFAISLPPPPPQLVTPSVAATRSRRRSVGIPLLRRAIFPLLRIGSCLAFTVIIPHAFDYLVFEDLTLASLCCTHT